MESCPYYSINFSPFNSSYVSVDFLFDVMATFLDFPAHGTNLATNFASYNDSYTSTLCGLQHHRPLLHIQYPIQDIKSILANCAIRINRSSFRTSIRLTFFMAYYNLDADYHQLVIATNFLVPCKLTSRGTTSTSYLPTDTFGDSL